MNTTPSPDLSPDLPWLNAAHALSLGAELSGHVVLLHFWTSTSVHCLHAHRTMTFLQHRFAGRAFAVVGVFTPRFAGEGEVDHVRCAIGEADVRYPVIVDERGELWREFECRAWPTVVLIDADGEIRFRGPGEPDQQRLADAVEALLDEAGDRGALALDPFEVEPDELPAVGMLRHPAGLAADPERGWLWIADTGNHRLVAVDPTDGAVRAVIGTGRPGSADGAFDEAAFYLPRGMVVAGDQLYVADTGNHTIRRVDLAGRRVETFLGQGRPFRDRVGGRAGRDQGLLSPWALACDESSLFVAVAGTHQVWRVDLATGQADAWAGNGREHLADGTGPEASFALPVGLARRDGELTVVDASSRALRVFETQTRVVRTAVGGGPVASTPPPLHGPTAVCWWGEDLIVADALDAAVKRWRPGTGAITEVVGAAAGLRRPSAVATMNGALFVVDTATHRLVRVDTDGAATEVKVVGEPLPDPGAERRAAVVSAREMSDVTVRIAVHVPRGERPHPDVPLRLKCENLEGQPLLVDFTLAPELDGDWAEAHSLPFAGPGGGVLRLTLSWLSCTDSDAVCHPQRDCWRVPVELDPAGDVDVVVVPEREAEHRESPAKNPAEDPTDNPRTND